MKKLCLISAVSVLFSVQIFAADFALRFMPEFFIPAGSEIFSPSVAGKVSVDFAPFTKIRGRDSIFLGANGGITLLVPNVNGVDTILSYQATGSLGYTFRFTDRLNLTAEGYGGIWAAAGEFSDKDEKSDESKIEEENTKKKKDKEMVGDLIFGGRASFNYYLLPELQMGLFADYGVLTAGKSPIMNKFSVGLNLRYSLTNGLFSSSKIETTEVQTDQLFPIFYSYYADHPFGELTFVNKESNDITDVEVFVFIEQFMSNPDKALSLEKVARGESFSAPLVAFLNENILNTLGSTETVAQIIVSYKSLGKRVRYTKNVVMNTVSRNSMTWEDDRRAAAFVSGRDASAYTFAQRVKSIVRDHLNPTTPQNIQYAAAMFSALKQYGINYVVDPASAFTDNVGTASVDFLQFPYQTLLYHGGDCDDLTILNCALLDAIGIRTAFITVPGHIYMAFDSGVSPEQANLAGAHVIQDGIVWIPLEITLCQDDFALERSIGYRQFVKHGENSVIIPLDNAWKEYKAVSVPDSDVKLEYPLSENIVREFKNQKF